ncbi:Hypothetical predicted protein [Podarcis lilfordi]|uniref:Uncharacterized protein n=1 Tax=Podarcis lilfordi TaxID=74358 RepID=A0AA35LIM5_9SAUR|nr:Hypothetical predicted protein [Podarcis lilfordi]
MSLTKLREAVEEDRSAWRALVQGVTKRRTRLNNNRGEVSCPPPPLHANHAAPSANQRPRLPRSSSDPSALGDNHHPSNRSRLPGERRLLATACVRARSNGNTSPAAFSPRPKQQQQQQQLGA